MLVLESAFPTLRIVTVREASQLNKVSISPKRNISDTYNLVCSNCTDTQILPPYLHIGPAEVNTCPSSQK